MTDEEIEKALVSCGTVECNECSYKYKCIRLSKDTLDYINRLKTENEDMHGELMSYKAYIDNHEEVWKSNADAENKRFVDNMKNVLEIEKEQVRKDTAKEILDDLKGLLEGYVDTRTNETLYMQKCKKYG